MDLKLKLNIVLALTFLIALAVTGFILDNSLRANALEKSKFAAIHQMDTAMAIRKYTDVYVKPYLVHDQEFRPASVPSFSATMSMKYFEDMYPGYSYREAALNPTNPKDLAKDWEIGIIKSFRDNPSKREGFHISNDGYEQYLHYIKPIKVSSPTCLQCHSTPDVAPATLIQKYGDKNGFGWKLDDVIGVQIVSVPMSVPIAESRQSLIVYIISIFLICSLFFVLLNLMLNKVIISPAEDKQRSLEKIANYDHLTGVFNRRAFEETLKWMIGKSHRDEEIFSLVFCDLDKFKSVNDNFGHDVGDAVLIEFSKRIGALLKYQQSLCRLGGEEFAIILPNTKKEKAMEIAETFRAVIADQPFEGVGQITCSFGISELMPQDDSGSLMKRADISLYKAKETGRNRVCIV